MLHMLQATGVAAGDGELGEEAKHVAVGARSSRARRDVSNARKIHRLPTMAALQ
ncbi:hypothetical protein [Phenylobacterium sp.]|uniref:hypothetical protein n=1 Tax=Phenylobacterium sp. TaxID=1871053 RepID=UPI0025E02DB2|nr:hypothetical protein [Phenylobacterium sp.]